MPIISLNIISDNLETGVKLLSVHNILTFKARVTYVGQTPDLILVKVYDSGANLLGTYKGIIFDDVSATERDFLFIADTIIRGFMQSFDDFYGTSNVTEKVTNITKEFTIKFEDPQNSANNDSVNITACHASRQFGENPCLESIANNDNDLIIGIQNFPTPIYFFNNNDNLTFKDIDILPDFAPVNGSGQSYYRKIYTNLTESDTQSVYTESELVEATKTLRVKNPCAGFKVLKYLDFSGQYRVYPFEKYYTIKDNPEKIGDTNELITSILNQTNSKNIGYRNEREIILVSDRVPSDELSKLSDLSNSPRVYLYVGTSPSNTANDWLLIKDLKLSDNIIKYPKRNFSDINVTIKLPEYFNITML